MEQVEVLDWSAWVMSQADMELCSRHPLAAQMVGVDFDQYALTEPVFSSDIASSIHDVTLDMLAPNDMIEAMVSAVTALPALDKLNILDRRGKMRKMTPLLAWLESSQCKVTSLALQDRSFEVSSVTLDAVSRMPHLKTLTLDVKFHSNTDSLLQVVRKSPTIDTIFIASEHMETMYEDIFDFQWKCRPRRLKTQLFVFDDDESTASPEKLLFPNKSHIVSLIYEFVDDFEQRFAPEGHLPLSFFPLLLENLNRISTDGSDFPPFGAEAEAKVRNVCPGIAFGFLQQLLGDPHRLLASRETSSGTEAAFNASDKRELKRQPSVDDDAGAATKKTKPS